ncbi:Peroxiredoxin [Tistlia consotensis]|uniref:Peroxiredoxin n=1 Tax=Tistlia consotensis USBA 355 TaxID=560819 RepID=A0A1Y6B9D7_9PROT|nr:redoxin domain-containing protein [Tistlia consotensis]SME97861.1 Peroxiredoxin [Tistlia consotensis USBA 355]SNR57228.1 Peroxiredoxin [Tistlia consotensis]
MSDKPKAGDVTPAITLPLVGGGEASLGGRGRWQLAVVYRGKHCPLCRRYLGRLGELSERFAALDTEILLLSGDPEEKAAATKEEWQVGLPIAYGLTVEQMGTLGLYVSAPRSEQETDRPFAEPGLFVTNPEGRLQVVDISNAPFARPDLETLANGLAFVQQKDYPIRGTLG